MDKDVKELLNQLADPNSDLSNLWELNDALQSEHPDDKTPLLKIFNEEQLELVKIIVDNVVKAFKFHEEFEESHRDIREKHNNIDAKLRNHRHPLNETFSAKPEF